MKRRFGASFFVSEFRDIPTALRPTAGSTKIAVVGCGYLMGAIAKPGFGRDCRGDVPRYGMVKDFVPGVVALIDE